MISTAFTLWSLGLTFGAAPVVVIEHGGATSTQDGVVLEAKIFSTAGRKVFDPSAFVRAPGSSEFQRLPMTAKGDGVFRVVVPAALSDKGCEYFLEAFDEDGNGPFRKGAPDRPLIMTHREEARPAPPPVPTHAAPKAQKLPAPKIEVIRATAPHPRRTAGIALVATGGAMVVGGAISGILALSDYNAEKTASSSANYDKSRSAAKTESVVADALYGAGAAVVVIGAILWITDRAPSSSGGVSLGASPVPGGACAVVTGRF